MSQRESGYQRKPLDQYETPAWVTLALIHFTLPARQSPIRLPKALSETKRTRADGDMRIVDADDIEQERHSEYRAAAADQAERKSDRAA